MCRSQVDRQPVLKADAIKFVMTFRNILTKEQHAAILPLVARHLTSKNQVRPVNTNHAHTTQGVLMSIGQLSSGPALHPCRVRVK